MAQQEPWNSECTGGCAFGMFCIRNLERPDCFNCFTVFVLTLELKFPKTAYTTRSPRGQRYSSWCPNVLYYFGARLLSPSTSSLLIIIIIIIIITIIIIVSIVISKASNRSKLPLSS